MRRLNGPGNNPRRCGTEFPTRSRGRRRHHLPEREPGHRIEDQVTYDDPRHPDKVTRPDEADSKAASHRRQAKGRTVARARREAGARRGN